MAQPKADALCVLILVTACASIGLPRYQAGIDWADEGFLAYGAVRVLEGEIPHRDFVSVQPPLSFYLLAAVFKVFGASLACLRVVGLCLYVLIALALYAAARQMARPPTALAAALPVTIMGMPYFNFVPFAVWVGMLAVLSATVCVLRGDIAGKPGWFCAGGFCSAAAVISRQDQGVYLGLAVTAYFLVKLFARADQRRAILRQLRGYLIGLVIPLTILLACWYAAGAIPSMYAQLIVFPLTTYAKTSSLPMPWFPSDMLTLREFFRVALFYVPPLTYVVGTAYLFIRFKRRLFEPGLAQLVFVQLLAWLLYAQVLARSDMHHLLVTLPPFFLLAALLANRVISHRMQRRSSTRNLGVQPYRAEVAILSLAVVWIVLVAGVLGSAFMQGSSGKIKEISGRRGGVFTDPITAKAINEVVQSIQQHAPTDRSILVLPYSPLFYFLAERRNPTSWNFLWPGDQTPLDHQKLVEQAQANKPAVITVMGESDVERYAPAILHYIRQEYRKECYHRVLDLTLYVPVSGAR